MARKKVDVEFKGTESVTGAAKKSAQAVEGLNKTVKDAQKWWQNHTIAIGAAMGAMYAAVRIASDLIAEYRKMEQAEARLSAAFRATGGEVGANVRELVNYAGELQKVTTFGDETTVSAMALLRSLTSLGEDGIRRLTPLVMDLAVGMFDGQLEPAMQAVAKTIGSSTNALGRYGMQIDMTQDQAGKLEQVIAQLQGRFGGMAQEVASRDSAALDLFRNAMGELKEQGGQMLVEFLAPSIRALTEFAFKVSRAIEESLRLKQAAKDLAEGKQVAAVDELKLANQRLADLKLQRQAQIDMYGEATAGIEQEVRLQQIRVDALGEVARYEGIIAAGKRKQDAEAVTAAAAEKKRQEDLAAWIKEVQEAYAKTPEGQRAILEASIARWEYELSRAKVWKPQIQAYLAMLYEQRDALEATGKTIKEQVLPAFDAWGRVIEMATINLDNLAAMEQRTYGKEAPPRLSGFGTPTAELDEEKEKAQSYTDWWTGMVSNAIGEVRSITEELYRNREAGLEDWYIGEREAIENSITDEEDRAAALDKLDADAKAKQRALKVEAAQAEKVGGLFSVAIATAEGIMQALATPHLLPWMRWAEVAAVTALGIAQAAFIAARPIPKFARGVQDFQIPPGYPNDSYLMRGTSGERVTVEPAGAPAAPWVIENILNLDGAVLARWLTEVTRNQRARIYSGAIVG